MSCAQELIREMRARGFRVTPQRAVILETIAHGNGHQSAQEVYQEAKKQLPGLNLATIYRTLDTLHRVGMVDLFSSSVDNVRFSFHDPKRPHHHLVCRNCGDVFEARPGLTDQLALELEETHQFILDNDHLALTGLCSRCVDK